MDTAGDNHTDEKHSVVSDDWAFRSLPQHYRICTGVSEMRMTILTAVLLSAGTLSAGHQGVVQIGGGTGFIVRGNLVVTALHCADKGVEDVGGVRATLVWKQKMQPQASSKNILSDGVAVYRLDGGPYKGLRLAKSAANGDKVRCVGYAGGRYGVKTGVLRGGDGENYNQTSFVAQPGDSGSPVLNSDGDVVGVVLASNPQSGTLVVGLRRMSQAVDNAEGVKPMAVQREVIMFMTPGCKPCDLLKADIQLGFYKKFRVREVEYRGGVWSDVDIYNEFIKHRDPKGDELGFPVIWVRGTPSYKSGYSSGRRGGLIAFIGGVIDKLASVVVGDRSPPPFPLPSGTPDSLPSSPAVETAPAPEGLEGAVLELKKDISDLKNGSILAKVSALKSLRSDLDTVKAESSAALDAATTERSAMVGELVEKVGDLRADITDVREGNPFLKAKAAFALKKDLPDTIALAKTVATDVKSDIDDVRNLKPEALIGLAGLVRAIVRRRRKDSDADLLEVAA